MAWTDAAREASAATRKANHNAPGGDHHQAARAAERTHPSEKPGSKGHPEAVTAQHQAMHAMANKAYTQAYHAHAANPKAPQAQAKLHMAQLMAHRALVRPFGK